MKDLRSSASKRRGGFTLIELVVVITIMTVLAGLVVPVASKIFDRDARKATTAEMQGIAEALSLYFVDTGQLPASPQHLAVDPGSVTGWAGPYLSGGVGSSGASATDFDEDGWGEAYTVGMAGDVWTLTSMGPDRSAGTSDDLAITVDVTPERRRLTQDRLAVINVAIRLYNEDWLSPPSPAIPDPLSDTWSTAYAQLVSRGYLANSPDYLSDGWGSAFVRTGTSGPVVEVTSPNTGS